MERTLLEKITGLRGMVDRLENPELVKKELDSIFEQINKEKNQEVVDRAMNELLKLTFDLMNKVDCTNMDKLMKLLNSLDSHDKEINSIKVDVERYKDVTVIKTYKKIPYSDLFIILKKAVKTFVQDFKDLESLSYDAKNKWLIFRYKMMKNKDIILNVSKWNLSDEVMEMYAEGLVEYLQK